MQRKKIAVIGAGRMAQTRHLPVYAGREDVEIVAVCDRNLQRAQECALQFGIPGAYAGARHMLENVLCDAVDICVWDEAHMETAVLAAEAGRHILCARPLAPSPAHVQVMEDAANKSGVLFMMAMPRRFEGLTRYARRLRETGAFGEVYHLRVARVSRRGTPEGWYTDRRRSGGGPALHEGLDAIDAAWHLLGCPRPLRVSATTAAPIGRFLTLGASRPSAMDGEVAAQDTEDSAAGFIHFENGASLSFDMAWAAHGPDQDEVLLYGDRAGAQLRYGDAPSLTLYGEEDDLLRDTRPLLPRTHPYEAMIGHFMDCLRGEAALLSPLEEGAAAARMAMGIYQSAQERREITL